MLLLITETSPFSIYNELTIFRYKISSGYFTPLQVQSTGGERTNWKHYGCSHHLSGIHGQSRHSGQRFSLSWKGVCVL